MSDSGRVGEIKAYGDPEERARAQGRINHIAFDVRAVASASSGVLVLGGGWMSPNLYATPVVVAIAISMLIIHCRREATAQVRS
jgi:hypothetical protein